MRRTGIPLGALPLALALFVLLVVAAVTAAVMAHPPHHGPAAMNSAQTCGLDEPLRRWARKEYGCRMAGPPPVWSEEDPWMGYPVPTNERFWPELFEGLLVERCNRPTGEVMARIVTWQDRNVSYACML